MNLVCLCGGLVPYLDDLPELYHGNWKETANDAGPGLKEVMSPYGLITLQASAGKEADNINSNAIQTYRSW